MSQAASAWLSVSHGEHPGSPQPLSGASSTHVPVQSTCPALQPLLLLLVLVVLVVPPPPVLPVVEVVPPPPLLLVVVLVVVVVLLVVLVIGLVVVVVAVVPAPPLPPAAEMPDVGNPQAPIQATAHPSTPRIVRAVLMTSIIARPRPDVDCGERCAWAWPRGAGRAKMGLRMNPARRRDTAFPDSGSPLASAETLVAEQAPSAEAPPPGVTAAPEPGRIIDGAYRVVRALGQGGMGIVLKAHDERLDRDVAIKVIRPRLLRIPDFHRRFLAEARAMARVRHENVVAIHAFGVLDGVPYFVMEYVLGTDLETWIGAHSPLHVDEAVGILAQICRGVQAIHDAGAVHRDLKPSNVLIGSGMRVAVADFGLAHLPAGEAGEGSSFFGGTPEYMAPELVADDSPVIGPASDLYSLGVIAYLLLTGRHPFPDARSLAARLQDPLPRPSEARPELPEAFDGIVTAALARYPECRPASAREMSEALQAARGRPAVSAPRPPRIVVADDDPHMRALLTATLCAAVPGARIESVADGQSALAALDREPADVALVDLQMPGLSGFEVTASLRASETGRRTPILIMTAVGGAADWRVLAAMGASGFLVKPFTPQQLAAAVSRALEVPA